MRALAAILPQLATLPVRGCNAGRRFLSIGRCLGVDEKKPVPSKSDHEKEKPDAARALDGTARRKASSFERFLLVSMGYYKTTAEIPEELPRTLLTRVWEKMRIAVNIFAIGALLVACYFMMRLGRKDLAEGKSYEKKILDWHEQIQKEHKEKMEKEGKKPGSGETKK